MEHPRSRYHLDMSVINEDEEGEEEDGGIEGSNADDASPKKKTAAPASVVLWMITFLLLLLDRPPLVWPWVSVWLFGILRILPIRLQRFFGSDC